MKFIISSLKLLKSIQALGGVIGSNNTLPILDDFLFSLTDGELRITASDLETTMMIAGGYGRSYDSCPIIIRHHENVS